MATALFELLRTYKWKHQPRPHSFKDTEDFQMQEIQVRSSDGVTFTLTSEVGAECGVLRMLFTGIAKEGEIFTLESIHSDVLRKLIEFCHEYPLLLDARDYESRFYEGVDRYLLDLIQASTFLDARCLLWSLAYHVGEKIDNCSSLGEFKGMFGIDELTEAEEDELIREEGFAREGEQLPQDRRWLPV